MIPKMTQVPCEVKDQWATVENTLIFPRITVFQGLEHGQQEDGFFKFEDYMLGECLLPLPFGLPAGSRIDVIYKYNLDQTLEMTVEGPDEYTTTVIIERPTLNKEEVAAVTVHLQRLEVE